MKITTNKLMSLSLAAAALMAASSCTNGDVSFPDNNTTAVYFSHQYPVRTLELADDYEVDNSLDQAHKCAIGFAFAGSYKGAKASVDVKVDNSLCDDLYLDDAFTIPIKPMPESYYSIPSTHVDVNGEYKGEVVVEFKEAFFEDKLTPAVYDEKMDLQLPYGVYAIPIVMTNQTGVDQILAGEYNKEIYTTAPNRNSSKWIVAPKDFVLYCVNYTSKYSSVWLRSGKDVIDGKNSDRLFENKFTIDDEKVYLSTLGLLKVSMPVSYVYDSNLAPEELEIVLTFDNDKASTAKVTVSAPEGAAYTVEGTGSYTSGGAGKYWGDRDRDLITLEYTIKSGSHVYKTSDQLVYMRSGLHYNSPLRTYYKLDF